MFYEWVVKQVNEKDVNANYDFDCALCVFCKAHQSTNPYFGAFLKTTWQSHVRSIDGEFIWERLHYTSNLKEDIFNIN